MFLIICCDHPVATIHLDVEHNGPALLKLNGGKQMVLTASNGLVLELDHGNVKKQLAIHISKRVLSRFVDSHPDTIDINTLAAYIAKQH